MRVLFVCLGNICRSPTAEGVFRELLRQRGLDSKIATDSAGTAAYHVGKPPDSRAQAAASARSIDIGDLRARVVCAEDFSRFDWIMAMDRSNLEDLVSACPSEHRDKVHLFLDFAPARSEDEVPDPYYGGEQGFTHVLDLVEEASVGLLEAILEDGRRTD